MQVNRSNILKKIGVCVVAFLLAFLLNGNAFYVLKAVIKDVGIGNRYPREQKTMEATEQTNHSGDAEYVVSGVSDYVQGLTVTLKEPAAENFVVQIYTYNPEDGQAGRHIGDASIYPGGTTCYMEIHQYNEGFVIREVSPNSGNVKDVQQAAVEKVDLNEKYQSPFSYVKGATYSYLTLNNKSAAKKMLVSFVLILLLFYFIRKDVAIKYNKKIVIFGILLLDIGVGFLFIKNAIRQSSYPAYQGAIIVMGLLCVLAISLGSYLLFIKKKELHKVYAVSGLLMGLAFMIMLPVYQVPDEPTHLYAAYDLSNVMLGDSFSNGKELTMRVQDAKMKEQTGQFTPEDYNNYYKSIFKDSGKSDLVVAKRKPARTWHYQYLMGALGITLGRVLGLGTAATFLLGRFFNLLLFVILMAYAIKKIPVGKVVTFVVALLPMTVQQSMSYSYDAILIPAVFLTLALSLSLAYEPEEKIKNRDYFILCISAMACMPSKGHAYFLSGLLPVIIWLNRRGEKKTNKKVFAVLVLALAALIFTAVFQSNFFPNIEKIPKGYQNYISWADAEGYTISGLLHQPGLVARIVYYTLTGYGRFYIESFLGSRLGWLELYISSYCVQVLMFLLILACIPRKENELKLSKSTVAIFWAVGILETIFVFAGLLISWTPITEMVIAGVQGRYFIPALIGILVSFQGKHINTTKQIDRPLCMASILALCWAMESIISAI